MRNSQYDYMRTNSDRDYAGQRTYLTFEEEDLLNELRELEAREIDLEYELDTVRDYIKEVRGELGRLRNED